MWLLKVLGSAFSSICARFLFVGELLFVGDECLRELVATGGWFTAAGDAFDALDDGVDVHVFGQCADGGEVAGASAEELKVGEFVVLDIEGDAFGAYTAWCEAVHDMTSFRFIILLYDSRWWIFCKCFAVFGQGERGFRALWGRILLG